MVRRVQDLVVEHRVVQGEAQTDGVRGLQGFGLNRSDLVGVLSLLDDDFALVAGTEFAQISIVITLHLEEEDFGLGVLGILDQHVVQQVDHVIADVLQLLLDLRTVTLDDVDVARALQLLLVLNGRNSAPGCTSSTH